MNFHWPILMSPAGGEGSGGLLTLVPFALMFVIMYMLLIRPQRKKQQEHDKLIKELKKGDKVMTNGGMFGTIFAIDEERNRVILKISEEVKLEFLKSSIASRVEK